MINSKRKGKVGELEFVHWLKDHGIAARRGQQYCGANNDPDVVTDLEQIHFEVKRTEKLNLHNAMIQAINDCPKNKIPVVAHRKSRQDWLVILRAEDALALLKGYIKKEKS